MAVLPQPAI